MTALKITLEVCLATLLIVLLAMLTWVALNLAADYLRMPLAQVIAGTGLVLTAGVGSCMAVDHVRTHNRMVLERAKRGLYECPDSFTAIDEEFAQRRRDRVQNMASRRYTQRPEVPPTAPPRGPRV